MRNSAAGRAAGLRPHPALSLGVALGATIGRFTQFAYAFNRSHRTAAHCDPAIGAGHFADYGSCPAGAIDPFDERHFAVSQNPRRQGAGWPQVPAKFPRRDSLSVKRLNGKPAGAPPGHFSRWMGWWLVLRISTTATIVRTARVVSLDNHLLTPSQTLRGQGDA